MKKALLILISLAPLCLNAQEFWTGAKSRYDVSDKFRASLELQARTGDRFKNLESAFAEPGLSFAPVKWLEVSQALRLDFGGNSTRINTDIEIKPLNSYKLSPSLRGRIQREWEGNSGPEDHLRIKGELTFNHSDDLEPFISGEWFYRMGAEEEARKYRLSSGIKAEITEYLKLDVFYMIEKELNRDFNDLSNIIGTMITLDIHKLRDD